MSALKEIKGGKIPMFCDTVRSWMSKKFKVRPFELKFDAILFQGSLHH